GCCRWGPSWCSRFYSYRAASAASRSAFGAACRRPPMTEPILAVTALSRHFGGLAAVSDVSLEVRTGEVHAVIGPNGAGKTTLVNMLSGDLEPSAGSIRLQGREIAGLSTDRIARLGIGRSYQKVNVFPEFTLAENCRLAAQAQAPSSMRFFGRAA